MFSSHTTIKSTLYSSILGAGTRRATYTSYDRKYFELHRFQFLFFDAYDTAVIRVETRWFWYDFSLYDDDSS